MPFDEDTNRAVVAAAIADLDSAAVGAAFNEATLDGIVTAVDAKINAILAALRSAGVIAAD